MRERGLTIYKVASILAIGKELTFCPLPSIDTQRSRWWISTRGV